MNTNSNDLLLPSAEELARWHSDYADQRREYRSDGEWHAACRLWDAIVLENEARWGRRGWPAVLAHRAECREHSRKQHAAYLARERAEYSEFAMEFEPKPPKHLSPEEALHWHLHAGRDQVDAWWARRREIDAQRDAMEAALRPAPVEPVAPTEDELIAAALAAPTRRSGR